MKKNLITFITAAAMLISTAAFAADVPEDLLNQPASAEDTLGAPVIQGDIMLISGVPETSVTPSYIANTVTVTDVSDEMISTTTDAKDAENPENTVNFTVTENTIVISSMDGSEMKVSDIKKDDTLTVFTSVYAPAPYILPPQYTASVIIVNVKEISSLRFYDVDTYIKNEEGNLVNLANNLELNLGEETKITGLKGKKITADELENKDLAVIYMDATKSIPAQITPMAIYVLGENEQALAAIEAAKTAIFATLAPEMTAAPESTAAPVPETTEAPIPVDFTKITTVNAAAETITNIYTDAEGNLMLPLRKITEALGFTVEWDGENRAVTLNSGMYSLKIGENSYVKGRMMPLTLSAAPEIKNDLTYVPVDYFIEVLEMAADYNGENTINLMYN